MTTVLVPASTGEMLTSAERLRVAVAAFLARYSGLSRAHTASDLRGFLDWCAQRGLDSLAASRPQLELFVRWMQETRRLKPSTVSRRTSVGPGSTARASSTACCSTPRPSTYADRASHRSPRPWG